MAKELPVLPATTTNGHSPESSLRYDCAKCPAYCCSYDWIITTKRDIQRLARRFGLTYEQAEQRFTKFVKSYGYRVLRHRQDHVFKTTCQFLHPTERRCTIYEHRPAICREYPEQNQCGYYDFLMWEREHQDDKDFIPLQK